jgi:hypothetical protein
MLRSLNEIIGYTLFSRDETIGKCFDFLFDEDQWLVRHLVAKTDRRLSGRKVLLPLNAIESSDWATRSIQINLTRRQVENSPPLDEDAPVSRQYEEQTFLYYGWPAYWEHSSSEMRTTGGLVRSVSEVSTYTVKGSDGEIGRIDDFIVDDILWKIRYIVIDIPKRDGRRKVLASPDWVSAIDLLRQSIHIVLTAELVANCPEYNPAEPINRDFESMLYDYYGRRYYWDPKKD